MFESAELGHVTTKAEYEVLVPQLRTALLDAQFDLQQLKEFAVVLLVNGVDGAGKGETVNLLNEWMDPRHIVSHAFEAPTEEERERPFMWRFWRALPPKGKIGILFGNWYTEPLRNRVFKRTKKAELDQRLDEINRFETMLVREGVLLIKLWFHLTREAQKQRLKSLEKNPETRWRVTERDWLFFENYDRFHSVAERMLRHTSTGHAPWIIVDGGDQRYRSLLAARTLLEAMQRRLKAAEQKWLPRATAAPLPPAIDTRNLLNSLQLDRPLGKADYQAALAGLQGRLALLTRLPEFASRSVVLVFEGVDAAGKGGAIRRLTAALDARQYRVVPVAAPSEEESAQPYLWRFWRQLPRQGKLVIFDRSWYGRVLVERVEGYCSEADWMRAFGEINDFEDQLIEAGAIVLKFWLSISKEEQLRRFREREAEPHKRYKITPEDWRNRERWDDYERAVCDMIDRSSTENAPWTLVEANNKYYARIKVLETVCDRIEAALK
ncbi:MAG TPA: polyphosphate:AMP phosphotransferase [Nitrospira sp.]|uniref:polyphosphate:AMP phosphotransferase n=1 Tax=Cognatazoarcus halotolerans TaxID=2686016 RepID=UPI0013585A96|nr:polyphosphate:AMP phosphotransferase [Cognatazoarcus halotolerans]MCB1898322.1 polyphosphate:AMP phosphotransferase [Rhodocyclaceae bacterium]MCP5308482.1 polyphosphate:AMP phosphotransferase [Zoogloeaceae bacterium]HQV11433.1 polyphosphate:AMP phosphotransferase [Nitrospira sp.]